MPGTFLTIDVEDWFHVKILKEAINLESWNSRESRIENNVEVILSILREKIRRQLFYSWLDSRETFFTYKKNSFGKS